MKGVKVSAVSTERGGSFLQTSVLKWDSRELSTQNIQCVTCCIMIKAFVHREHISGDYLFS